MVAKALPSAEFLFTQMNYYTGATARPHRIRIQYEWTEIMAALPNILTVAEFRELPEGGEFTYELHHGEVVPVTRPSLGHWAIQKRLARLLESKISSFGVVGTEFAYRPVPEYDLRAADVAAVSHQRFDASDFTDNIHGAPDLVIEVKSPSNTRKKLTELVSLCLATGAREVWILEPDKNSVAVYRRGHPVSIYRPGDAVPLAAFESDALPVDDIFNESSHR
jgi:Uma2 family endonuclease